MKAIMISIRPEWIAKELKDFGLNKAPQSWCYVEEPKKKVGDLLCSNVSCFECPLHLISCGADWDSSRTIRTIYGNVLKAHPELEPMRAYFETELNKEVEKE